MILVIYLSRSDRWGDLPLYEALVQKLRHLGVSGATAHLGAMGFGEARRVRLQGLFGIHEDEPVTVMALESEAKLRQAIPHLRGLAPCCTMALVEAEIIPQKGACRQ